MEPLDIAFLIFVIAVWLYAFVTPGRQLMPPFWKLEERMNWKPTQLSIVVGFIALIYLVLKK
jgi:Kef-type K+ transport system membrane component KefB